MRIAIVDDFAEDRALLRNRLERQLQRRSVQADFFEYESGERLFIRRMSHGRVSIHVNTIDWRDICWCRHVLKDCIKKFLYTFISVS